MLKRLVIAGAMVVALIIGAVVFLLANVNSIVKDAIEAIGPEMTGVTVKVSKVSITVTSGRGELDGLVVGSPKGYKEPHTMRLGSIVLGIDPVTTAKDVIVIHELTVESPDVAYEKGPGGSNVDVIQQNVDKYVKEHFGGGQSADKSKKAGSPGEKRFIVENLQIRNGKARVVMLGKEESVSLPPVSLHDVGKSHGGVTGGELASIVIKQMISGTITSAGHALAQDAKGVGDKIKGMFQGR